MIADEVVVQASAGCGSDELKTRTNCPACRDHVHVMMPCPDCDCPVRVPMPKSLLDRVEGVVRAHRVSDRGYGGPIAFCDGCGWCEWMPNGADFAEWIGEQQLVHAARVAVAVCCEAMLSGDEVPW